MTNNDEIRIMVQERYAKAAEGDSGCCNGEGSSCCGATDPTEAEIISLSIGYSDEELSAVPAGANLGLGCGNPQAIAALKPGETVIDLGSGAGFDCFLAASAVGETGRVIGVDMTPSMLSKARKNAEISHFSNVEFRLGEIEHLPVGDATADIIISNCVINLSPDKAQVFREAFRVLNAGGRLAVSDIVATADLPEHIRNDMFLYSGCMSGAETIDTLTAIMRDSGFVNISIAPKDESREFIREWAPGKSVEDYLVSASITAEKPA